jgi:hypothetical protein
VKRTIPGLATNGTPVLKIGAVNCTDKAKNNACIFLEIVKQYVFAVTFSQRMLGRDLN